MTRTRLQYLNNGTEDSISSQQMSDPPAYRFSGEDQGNSKHHSRHASGDSGRIPRMMSSLRGAVPTFGQSVPKSGSISSTAGSVKPKSMRHIPDSSHSRIPPPNQANRPIGDEGDISALPTFPPVATPTSLMSSQTLFDPPSRNRSSASAFERLDTPAHGGENSPLPGRERAPMNRTEEHPFAEPPIAAFKPSFSLYMAFATMAVFTLMVALDSTALSVALPVIADKLHGTALEAFWAATSYLLTSTVFQPTIGALSDEYGRKWISIISGCLFMAGIIISGASNNFTILLTGRTIQGIGGGGVEVLCQLIICDLVPLRLRGQWFGVISSMYAIGTVSGPLLGGVFSEKVTWRWIFWVNLPFVGTSLVMIPIFINTAGSTGTFFHKISRLDWGGSALFVASTTAFLIPLSWGGVQFAWSSWHTLVPLILGGLGNISLYFYEGHIPKNPIIRTRIFKNRNSVLSFVQVVLHGLIVTTTLYYLPLYYEAVKGLTPIMSGVALFPETFTIAPCAFLTGAAIARFNSYRWAIWSGWAITTLGVGILCLMDVNTTTVEWVFMNLVLGIGSGFNYVALGVMLQAATAEEDMTSAVSLFTVFRPLGQALGVAIGGVIFQNQMKTKLDGIPSLAAMSNEYASNGAALAQIITAMPPSPNKTLLVQAYADSLKIIWIVLCALSGFALLTSIPIKAISLDGELEKSRPLSTASGGGATDSVLLANAIEDLEKHLISTPASSNQNSIDPTRHRSSAWPSNSGGKTVGSRPHRTIPTISAPLETMDQHSRLSHLRSSSHFPRNSQVRHSIHSNHINNNRSSSRYSREIGGFFTFPTNLNQTQLYRPASGELQQTRPNSVMLLPYMEHQPSLADLVDDDFERLMREGQ